MRTESVKDRPRSLSLPSRLSYCEFGKIFFTSMHQQKSGLDSFSQNGNISGEANDISLRLTTINQQIFSIFGTLTSRKQFGNSQLPSLFCCVSFVHLAWCSGAARFQNHKWHLRFKMSFAKPIRHTNSQKSLAMSRLL